MLVHLNILLRDIVSTIILYHVIYVVAVVSIYGCCKSLTCKHPFAVPFFLVANTAHLQ